ncbi:MAG TPA: hypothetical protein VMU56_01490 [Beijerinckiaceae bacterium]|nr:hypothetical protein [Beijerinckiaceae bacterium]
MYSIRVAVTRDFDFPPADPTQTVNWERLTEMMRREVSPDAAALFAEPIADPVNRLTYWHAETDFDPAPLSHLTPRERTDLLAQLELTRAAILKFVERLAASVAESDVRLAQALRVCLTVPDPDRQIWSLGGRPLLVAWGRTAHAIAPRVAQVVHQRIVEPAPEPPRAGIEERRPLAPLAEPQGAGAAARFSLRPGPWLGWIPFLVLMLAIYSRLLPACALDLPLLRSDRCSGAERQEVTALLQRNDGLFADLRRAQKKVLAARARCGGKKAELAPAFSTPGPSSGVRLALAATPAPSSCP